MSDAGGDEAQWTDTQRRMARRRALEARASATVAELHELASRAAPARVARRA